MQLKKWLCLVVLLLSAAGLSGVRAQELPRAEPAEVGMSAERLARLSAVMRQYVDNQRVAGLVTLVIRDGKVAHLGTYGYLDLEKKTPMRPDAIFRIASQSKAVTTAAVMILQEEGRLLLSDPVSKYLPEFSHVRVATRESGAYREEPAKRPITIRDLLTHTAGISYGGGAAEAAYRWEDLYGWYFADHDETIGEAIRRLATLPIDAQPGEKYIYGFNTDILGRVVEVVSGQSLADFFQERIFTPLKMTDTHFFLPPEKVARFTPVYGHDPAGRLYLVEPADRNDYVSGPRKCYSGGAGLLSTARDYGRFLLALLNGGTLEGVRILSRKSVELMTSNHVGDKFGDRGFGLGFWITEHVGRSGQMGSVGAFGWGGAYYTTYWVDPQERLVALLMCQLLPARDMDLHPKFSTLVYQALE
ncbi:MAG: serine hydrolase domain-containing protein [Acidobacteriota bacterium]